VHALVYSMLQVFNRNTCTLETVNLHGRMIAAINHDIEVDATSAELIGAVMLLTASATRFDDFVSYSAHAQGLGQLLDMCDWQDSLTPAAARSVFWLDLFSSICLNAPRRVSHHFLPDQPSWSRILPAENASQLPVGFCRHKSLLPDDLLDCLQDTVEMQTRMKNPACRKNYMLLDNMQASIESRLSFQGTVCRLFGSFAEMVRLAAFICCYCSWTDTWESNVVPSKVAKLLLDRLEKSLNLECPKGAISTAQWHSRGDLLLWLVFVGSVVAQGKEFVVGLRESYARIIDLISNWVSQDLDGRMWSRSMLEAVRNDFLYCDVWRQRRLPSREWFVLEVTFGLTC
jgi:hypothetical protein